MQPSLFERLTGAEVMEDQVISAFTALLKSQRIPLLPREITLTRRPKILDVACGEGEWVNTLGFELDNPTRETPGGYVVGVDVRPHRVAYAQARARTRSIDNVSFQVEYNLCQLKLPENTYDLVHLHGLACSISQDHFPTILTEAMRLLRPGGTLICAECVWPKTNAVQCLALADLILHILKAVDYASVQVDQLGELLCSAGYTLVRERVTTINLSAGTEGNWLLIHRFIPLLYFLLPFLRRHNIMNEEQFMTLLHDLRDEVSMPSFRAEWPLVTAIGEKPS